MYIACVLLLHSCSLLLQQMLNLFVAVIMDNFDCAPLVPFTLVYCTLHEQ